MNAAGGGRVPRMALPLAALLVAITLPAGSAPSESTPGGPSPGAVTHRAGGQVLRHHSGPVPYVRVFRLGVVTHEPTLGVTRAGDVFYSAWQAPTEMDVVRSRDSGESWELVSPRAAGRNAHVLSFDAYVYVDQRTGRVFTLNLAGFACSVLSYSDDAGENWATNPLACGRPVNDHQTLFAGPPATSTPAGYDNVVYYCWNDIVTSSCSKSLDGGDTFAPTGEPAFSGVDEERRICSGLTGHGVVGDDGTVYLSREICGRPFLAISKDEGRTWERVEISRKGSPWYADPSVDVDSDGNVYYGWIARNRLPYLAVSRDGGSTLGKPMMVAAPGVEEANLMTLDAGAPGRVAFLYMATPDARHPKAWNGYLGSTTTLLTARPVFHSARVNPAGDPLKRGTCGPGRCGDAILDFLDVVVARDGTAWGAFVDACNDRCRNGDPDAGNEAVAVRLLGGEPLR